MGWKHPGQGKVVEPSSARGMPEDVQTFARSLMGMAPCKVAHGLPSLWLREVQAASHLSKRLTMLNFPCFPVLTTRAPSLERHQPDSMRITSPTLTCLT